MELVEDYEIAIAAPGLFLDQEAVLCTVHIEIFRAVRIKRFGQRRLAHLAGTAQKDYLPVEVRLYLIMDVTLHVDYFA